MRAVLLDRHGPPEVLTIADLPLPEPGPGQLRVRVHAGGVQPFDTYVRRGLPGFRMDLPHQLGNEFAGVIDRVGPEVRGWSAGDAVLGSAPLRSLAEYVLADATAVVGKPAALPMAAAGALPASGQTALTALRELRVGPGDTLLVHAAAGGAGTMAVQLARHYGARVIGTASAANHHYLAALGATPVRYGPGLPQRVRELAPRGVDAVLDAVGGQALRDSLELAPDRDRIGTLVEHALAEELGVRGIRAQRSTAALGELAELCRRGVLRVGIRARFPLEAIADAHSAVETGHGSGKVVIVLDG
ncbi:NADP-dependent oxidoreductase [Amycolatopsis aidingensis]|uniref:NADP-dependent oxidoreductase n=1 Tax=Amycolatopsis aidingensis TaxID=2842453 RepID=UPI001C0C8BF7|nr:NADP-dependent oxidoreductase [Amycolatopsis aidingensis]